MTPPAVSVDTKVSELCDRVLLTHFTVSMYRATKADKESGDELAEQKKADKTMVTVTKRLLESGAMSEHTKIERRMKKWWKQHTLPFTQESTRMLPNEHYFDFVKEFNECNELWEKANESFFKRWPTLKAEAKKLGGDFLKDEYYPSVQELQSKFVFEYQIFPMPSGSGFFQSKFSDAENKRIQKQIDKASAAAAEQAVSSMFKRFIVPVAHMRNKLTEYKADPTNEVATKFHESLLTNIEELIDLVPTLNITNNKELEKIAIKMTKELTHYDVDTLRSDADVRAKVINSADDILTKLNDYFS